MQDEIMRKIHETFSVYPKRTYPKGQIIIFGGENPGHIFYLTEGRIRQYDVSYRGEEVIINIFKPPAYFPMSHAINGNENNYFYKTETDTQLHVVPSEAAVDFLKNNPDVMFDLLSRLYRGMDGVLGRMVHLMSGSAQSRLMYELIIECRRIGEPQPDGTYLVPLSENDLAGRSGLTRETVSREIKKLKVKNLIEIQKSGILISDLQMLEQRHSTAL